jgi:hypothetical protein
MWRMEGTKILEKVQKTAPIVLTIIIYSLSIFPLDDAEALKEAGQTEGEYWELTKPNFPFALIDWQLVTNRHSSDKYMDKHIVGTVKNTSTKEFSEIKIAFIVYDEEGAQIGIVFSNHYDFEPSSTWKFNILVTEDVKKAEFKGLYAPTLELKKLENEQKTKGKEMPSIVQITVLQKLKSKGKYMPLGGRD